MATLDELRDYVRTQTETTVAELPNATIDGYLREAFNRTINRVNKWPFYEAQWVLTLTAGTNVLTIPPDVNKKGIVSLIIDTNGPAGVYPRRLQMVDLETAEDLYLRPGWAVWDIAEFSVWGDSIYMLPPDHVRDYDRECVLRGYRLPQDWIAAGETAEVDADSRLHWPLTHYAIALAYAQQEDDQLETQYMQRWQRDVDQAISVIMEPVHDLPFTMGGGKRTYRT